MEKLIAILQYTHASVEYQDLDKMSLKLLNVDSIFITRHQKYDFSTQKLEELSMQATVVHTEYKHEASTFKDEISSYLNHQFGKYRCIQNIGYHILKWLLECLPR